MLKYISLIIGLVSLNAQAQYNWTWTPLAPMPVPISNNAVCEAFVGNDEYVYSFSGIDTTKLYSGINLRSFKYDVAGDSWSEIASLPDTLGKIAAGASYVNGKIYIIGGYHVFSNGSELSSDKVHIYDPTTDTYEADGAPIPVPIDDQVQCVYKDSLIFVVTGWSNTSNKPDVQIYDPANNHWLVGTPVPNNNSFKAFGASGHIIGDTLYYHGGTSGSFSFAARTFMRKGYINPSDPTDISWTQMDDAPGDSGYRSACSGIGNNVFWVGGAAVAYNYNGVAYNGSGGVDPSARILHFTVHNYQHNDQIAEPYGVMDLRGIAKLSNDRWIICGGMDTNQVVSNRTFLLENPQLNIEEPLLDDLKIRSFEDRLEIFVPSKLDFELIDLQGRLIQSWQNENQITLLKNGNGIHLLKVGEESVKIQL